MDKEGLLVGIIFYSFCSFMCLGAILKPKSVLKLTEKWFKFSLKLYGFEGDIGPGAKAEKIVQVWNLIGFLIFIILIIILLINYH